MNTPRTMTAVLLLTATLATAPLTLAAPDAAPNAAKGGPPSGKPGEHWVTSWYASPQAVWGPQFVLPTGIPASLQDQTIHETIRVSVGGSRVRLVFSNRYGSAPLHLGEVRIAQADAATSGAPVLLTFNGLSAVAIPPGAQAVSDAAVFALAPLARLTVSTYLPDKTALTTFHWGAQQSATIVPGRAPGAASDHSRPPAQPGAALTVPGRLFVSALLADAAPAARTVVVLGDSITDGNGSTPGRDRRWTDFLASRFSKHQVAVANAGISGARVLGDLMGANALARFEQDVLAQPGVATVIVLLGINDIGWPGSPFDPQGAPVDVARLIGGYQQLIASARLRKLRIIGATLPPFEGALRGTPFEGHYSEAKERQRQQVNAWIRDCGAFDAVADIDALLRDGAHPSRLDPRHDSGDHLHPGDAGYQAMADAFDMALLFGRAGLSLQD